MVFITEKTMPYPIRHSHWQPLCALVCAALVTTLSIPISALAQTSPDTPQQALEMRANSANFVNATNAADASTEMASGTGEQASVLAALVARATSLVRIAAADAALVYADAPLDDQVLSHQRGGSRGMMTVAASQSMLHNSVTLWDEIVPPTPLPQPSDAARAAQGNNVVYTRK
jgi:hypothetical protein